MPGGIRRKSSCRLGRAQILPRVSAGSAGRFCNLMDADNEGQAAKTRSRPLLHRLLTETARQCDASSAVVATIEIWMQVAAAVVIPPG